MRPDDGGDDEMHQRDSSSDSDVCREQFIGHSDAAVKQKKNTHKKKTLKCVT